MIMNENIKMGKEVSVLHLSKLFNNMIKNNWIPKQREEMETILLYKKSNKDNIENYRPICLTTNICNIFSILIKNRIFKQIGRLKSK